MAQQDFMIRSAHSSDVAAIGEIVVSSWQHTFSGLLPREFLSAMSAEHQTARHLRALSKPGVVYRVATVEGAGVVGFASGGPGRGADCVRQMELYAIYLRPEFRRRGIGRAMFVAVAGELIKAGVDGFCLTVLSMNPNIEFYRAMGGREVKAPEIQLGAERYTQVGFVWSGAPDNPFPH